MKQRLFSMMVAALGLLLWQAPASAEDTPAPPKQDEAAANKGAKKKDAKKDEAKGDEAKKDEAAKPGEAKPAEKPGAKP